MKGPILRDRKTLVKPDRYSAHAALIPFEPVSYAYAISCPDKDKWIEAMNEEMQSHDENGTWILVDKPQNVKPMDCRWIFKIKYNKDGSIERYKARIVVKGYKQQFGIDYFETFAAVCRYESTSCY